jgi:DNA mismatch endonuclease (patch repair protein)
MMDRMLPTQRDSLSVGGLTTAERRPLPSSTNARNTMRANRSTSNLERRFRKELWRRGLRYRLASKLPGRPDLVFASRRLVVFVNGCFWHSCPTCRPPMPRANGAFWKAKLLANRNRDAHVAVELREIGWDVVTVWECRIRADMNDVADSVVDLVRQGVD